MQAVGAPAPLPVGSPLSSRSTTCPSRSAAMHVPSLRGARPKTGCTRNVQYLRSLSGAKHCT